MQGASRTATACSAPEDAGLLGGELLLGEDALVLQLGQVLSCWTMSCWGAGSGADSYWGGASW